MIVAYDLRYAADHFTGIGTHAFHLIEALLEQPGEDRYTVLWNPRWPAQRHDVGRIQRHPRVTWHERTIHPLRPEGLFQLGAWLRQSRPDVYMSPNYLRPVGARCPDVITIHDVGRLRGGGQLSLPNLVAYRASLAWARGASAIITSSEFSRGEVASVLALPPARLHVVRPGVPADPAVAPRRPSGMPEGRFMLVVGDNRPHKNLATLARAWALLDPPPLLLVGVGPVLERFPTLDALAAREGARGVTALGWRTAEELEWLYRHADAILFPTRYEGFGFPLVEAFARGLPAIASDIPALREIGEGAARFVSPDEPGAWAGAVRALAGDEPARLELARSGSGRASELTYRKTGAGVLSILRGLVSTRPRRGDVAGPPVLP